MKAKLKNTLKFWPLYLMMLPGLTYIIINNYIPLPGLMLAFKKYNYSLGMWKSPLNGIDNFKYLFASSEVLRVVRNTVLYNLAFIVLGNILAITVAVLLNQLQGKKVRKAAQTTMLIPYLISTVIVSYMVFALLSTDKGMLNGIITTLGGKRIQWYMKKQYWPYILTIVQLWKSFGYSSVLYYSTIISIDPNIYEAAAVDGAGRWRQFCHVTLPSLKMIIITMVMLSVSKIFYSDFGLFYQVPMNSGPIRSVTGTVDTYVYNALMNLNDIGRSAAAGFLQAVLGFILIFIANLITRKIDRDSALM